MEQSIFFEGYGVEGDKNVMGLESASTCVFYACGVIDGDKPHPLPASTGTVTCTGGISVAFIGSLCIHILASIQLQFPPVLLKQL